LQAYTCTKVPDGWNDCDWCDPKCDELYKEVQDPTPSHKERRNIIWEMQEMFQEARAYVTYAYDVSLSAYRSDRFTNFNTQDFHLPWYPKPIMQMW